MCWHKMVPSFNKSLIIIVNHSKVSRRDGKIKSHYQKKTNKQTYFFNVFSSKKCLLRGFFERNFSFMVVLNFGRLSVAVTTLVFFKDTMKAYFCYLHTCSR